MSIKIISGLGVFKDSVDSGGNTSTSRTRDGADVIVDHSALIMTEEKKHSSLLADKEIKIKKLSSVPVDKKEDELSKESSIAPFETLFDKFDIEAYPFYNFWVADETTNDSEDAGDRALEDIPRFIRIVWNKADDLPGYSRSFQSTDKVTRKIKSVKLVSTDEYIYNGMFFSPGHMRKDYFSMIKNQLANGYIGPGVIEAVVELSRQANPAQKIFTDLSIEKFLSHPDTVGMSFNELKAQMHELTNGVVGSSKISAKASSKDFDGSFSVSTTPGKVTIESVAPSSPSISFTANTTSGDLEDNSDVPMSIAKDLSSGQPLARSQTAKVKFVDPGIDDIVSSKRVGSITKPEHAENTIAMAQSLPYFEILRMSGIENKEKELEIPSFPSPSDLKPLEYIGYVIEKYKRNKSGIFEKTEEIDVTDRECGEYVDARVLYGQVYRYRIHAILRWTRKNNIGVSGRDPYVKTSFGSTAAPVAKSKSSYFAGEWSNSWAYATCIDTQPPAPPDEIIVRPESARRRICVTFRMPHDPQRDIHKMMLSRKLLDESGNELTGWIVLQELPAANTLYYDTNVDFFQKNKTMYVYSAQCLTLHGEKSRRSDQVMARLNQDHDFSGEFDVELVSCSGVRPEYFGSFSVYPHVKMKNDITSKSDFMLSGRTMLGSSAVMNDSDYVMRIVSLDTGETINVPVTVKYENKSVKTTQMKSIDERER